MTGFWLEASKRRILLAVGILVPCIALFDWSVGNRISLGVLYILPMMIGAVVLNAREAALLAIVCAFLRAWFDTPASPLEATLRFVFAWLAYFLSGLFVMALVRNRRVEEQLRVLVESSPAAILTLDRSGRVLGSNNAAHDLFLIPEGRTLQGQSMSGYLPLLSDAVRLETTHAGFRTAAQCQGRRANGEIFRAHTWFSSYDAPDGKRLAAIVVDSSEEMREQEEQNLVQLRESNRVIAAAVSHEIKTLCRALSLLTANLKERRGVSGDPDFEGLVNLISGLEKIAQSELHQRVEDRFHHAPLKEVLDNLRIVVEPNWHENGGVIHWRFPDSLPAVMADAHGLLQVFLNLVENSYRAVQSSSKRELTIGVSAEDQTAFVRFQDSGPGIAAPDLLFQPFQFGADGAGMGLFIARAALRSYGGDLRFEPQSEGACFVVELQVSAGHE